MSVRNPLSRLSALLLVALAGFTSISGPSIVRAADPTCTVAASGGNYTTIQAAVNDSDCTTINVAAGTYTENVTIGRDVTINGSTTGSTIVDGNNADPVFKITSGTVTLANLTIQHGSGAGTGSGNERRGGGIYMSGNGLTVTNSTISNNSATIGGGIYFFVQPNTVDTVIASTISNNSASIGAGIESEGDTISGNVIVRNSTITGNSGGGGIYNSIHMTVANSTITGNTIGIANIGSLTLVNTIVAHSSSSYYDCANFRNTDASTNGHNNLIEDAGHACDLTNGVNGNIIGQDPLLGPLADNGGPTQTFALLAGSPAIDAASATDCPSTDQRGVSRYPGNTCDIGAYEADPTIAPSVTLTFPAPTGKNGWYKTSPVVGSLTAVANASITDLSCTKGTLSNQRGLNTSSVNADLTISGDGITDTTCRVGTSSRKASSASAELKIDTVAPDTTITNQTTDAEGTSFTFTGSDSLSGVASYECRLDSAAFTACTSPQRYTGSSSSTHTFEVRAIDVAGNSDPTPASATIVPPTATPTATAIATATSTNTPMPPTATATSTSTPVPPTATKTATPVPPTSTPINTPVPPTNIPTNTPVPPTATPTNTPTNTPVPPTNIPTNTPVPSTATATVTSTSIPVPPTRTPFPTVAPTITATPPAPPMQTTITPVADSYVQQSDSSKNFGTNTNLTIDGSDDTRHAYLRFTVGSLRGRVTKATLRVYVATNGTKDGPKLYRAANDTWGETTLTWKNQPGTSGPVLGDLGAIGTMQWVQYDVTATVTSSGTYSFVFVGDGTDSVSFLSRESTNPPQLVLTVQP